MTTTGDVLARRVLGSVWWVLFPAFALLVVRLSHERGCGDPNELLRSIMDEQPFAVLVAAIYVLAHVWVIAAGVLTVRRWPGRAVPVGYVRDSDRWKIVMLILAIAIEQVPRAGWGWLYRASGLC